MKTPTLIKVMSMFIIALCVMLMSCNKKELTVVTNAPTNVTSRTVTCGGSVDSNDPLSITDKGIICTVHENPTLDGVHEMSPSVYHSISAGTGTGDFSFEINFIDSNTTYYVRAYAICDGETYYGDIESFRTLE